MKGKLLERRIRGNERKENESKGEKNKKLISWKKVVKLSVYVQEDVEEGQLSYIWRKNENE